MAKTNFTKVEEALAEGLRKMEVDRLLGIADEVKAMEAEGKAPSVARHTPEQKQLLALCKFELRRMKLTVDDLCKKLQMQKEALGKLLRDNTVLTEADWVTINKLKVTLIAARTEAEKGKGEISPEEFVEQQRKKQKTKRFNVNDKWLPLK